MTSVVEIVNAEAFCCLQWVAMVQRKLLQMFSEFNVDDELVECFPTTGRIQRERPNSATFDNESKRVFGWVVRVNLNKSPFAYVEASSGKIY